MHLLSLPWRVLVTDDPYFADPSYERENFAFLDTVLPKGEGVFVDIGAHQGLFSTYLSQRAGEKGLVYAFEPNPSNLRYLIYNTSFKPSLAPVIVLPIALADEPSTGFLQCWNLERPLHSAMCQLGKNDAEPADFQIPVPVRRLDDIDLPKIDFIKIDEEHWEFKVLLGAEETIKRDRPLMLIEIHNDETRKQIRCFAEEHDFLCEHRHAHVHGVQTKSEYLYLKSK